MDSSTSTSETSENVFLLVFISSLVFFGVRIHEKYFFHKLKNQTSNGRPILELFKKRSKLHQRNMSRESALNFHQ